MNTITETEDLPGDVTVERKYEIVNNERFLVYECWYKNGKLHREGDSAIREWKIVNNEQVLVSEYWYINGKHHREGGAASRIWKVLNGERVLVWEYWYLNGQHHREDDAAFRSWEIVNNVRVLRYDYWSYKGKRHTYGMKSDSDGDYYKRGKIINKKILISSGKIIFRFMCRLRVKRSLRRKAISAAITGMGCVVFPGLLRLIE